MCLANGAGKTTTIRMLATLLRPDAGSARIFGHDVQAESQIVRQLIGVTGQYASVDESLSATENLIIFSRLLGLGRKEARRKAEERSRNSVCRKPRSGAKISPAACGEAGSGGKPDCPAAAHLPG